MMNLLEAASRKSGTNGGAALSPPPAAASTDGSAPPSSATAPSMAQTLQAHALLSHHAQSMAAAAQLQALLPQLAGHGASLSDLAASSPHLSQQMATLLHGAATPSNSNSSAVNPSAAQMALLQQLMASSSPSSPATASVPVEPPAVSPQGSAQKASSPKKKAASKPPRKATPSSSLEDRNALDPDMSHWPVEKLESHVTFLEQHKRPVPYTLKLLLGNAKRKEEKRQAKRIANRKFAHISRTRKKAFVQELTQQNEQLKRHSKILSLLPDVVFVIGSEGDITFCSDRAERVLRYDMEELVGLNMTDILAPSSTNKVNGLIKELLLSESPSNAGRQQAAAVAKSGETSFSPVVSESSANEASGPAAAAAVSNTNPSFPMSVVQVKATSQEGANPKTSGVKAAAAAKTQEESAFVSNEDSGYSSLSTNDSQEQTASANDFSGSFGRKQPIAPTCTICLQRKDQKEIWCEATLTVISHEPEEESLADQKSSQKKGSSKSASASNQSSNPEDQRQSGEKKELLLSVRPFRSSKKRSRTSRTSSQKQEGKRQSSSVEQDSKRNKGAQQYSSNLESIAQDRGHNVTPNPDASTTKASANNAPPQSAVDEDVAKSLLLMHRSTSPTSS